MPGEVVGAKLILRIEPLFLQIIRPFFQRRPILFRIFRIAFDVGDGRDEDEQITAFLDGHLILLVFLPAAVNLPVGLWISPQIVRREGKFPAIALSILQNRSGHPLDQRRVEKQEHWG